jgi:hypothetical protein
MKNITIKVSDLVREHFFSKKNRLTDLTNPGILLNTINY